MRWGTATGAGLVIANMIGATVFVSAGFMAQQMGPLAILLSWVVGGALALCGVRAYGELAKRIPMSGGEYRYLGELLHPSIGYVAGWGSMLLGFAAPVAIDAFAAASYLDTVVPVGDPRIVGSALILALTALHAVRLDVSMWSQNALVLVKIGLVCSFAAFGLAEGAWRWPTWSPPHPDAAPVATFLANQFWVAFAFSGWNAAIYAASEFTDAARQVPRAMAWGCAVVSALYLVVNWVFVANLTPADAAIVSEAERVTLGHVIVSRFAGPEAASVMSGVAVVAFASAMSAMILVGARVTAAMAEDGMLPAFLTGRRGAPPVGALAFQATVATALLWTTSLHHIVQSAAAILLSFTGLTALGLFRVAHLSPHHPPPPLDARVAAALYATAAFGFLFHGFRDQLALLAGLLCLGLLGVGAWAVTPNKRGQGAAGSGSS